MEDSNDESEIESKKDHEEEEDYSKLLKDLDEEDDEDIVAKVLKRYGLKFVFSIFLFLDFIFSKHDFDYALPEREDENSKNIIPSFQNYMPVHEISLD